jgi:hypothetical protein
MKKYLVLYMMPHAGMEEWMKTSAEQRKAEEEKMQKEWGEWTNAHKAMFVEMPAGAGKSKRVTKAGAVDAKNDIMLYSVMQGESYEAVVKALEGHPHLGIPEAWIEVMPINSLPGMAGM